jgi:hypothetical protein
VDWIHLAKHRTKWQAVVNTVINLRFSIKGGEFLSQLSVLSGSQGVRSLSVNEAPPII